MNPTSLLRTRERDLRQFGPPERGVRHWTHVEVPTDIWFVVEGRVNPLEGEPYRKRFVVADFADALRLHRESGFDNAMLHVEKAFRESTIADMLAEKNPSRPMCDGLTGADFMLSFPLLLGNMLGWFESLPRTAAYIGRIAGRPAFASAIADTLAYLGTMRRRVPEFPSFRSTEALAIPAISGGDGPSNRRPPLA